jgi:class 3 adenylate cyclase
MQNDAQAGEERQPSMERRLATIMMADVAGYSRMMGENEERTVQTLRGHRKIFDALLQLHRGRIFNTAGDAILAEFPSAVEAVRCATELQAALRTRNEHLPEEERMWFRIGINLGDVIVQGGDLLGDGVNVAARIQTIAEPGGICISGSVYDQIQNKLTLQFNLMGERSFKNIAQPIRTFSISEADGAAIPVALASKKPMMMRKLFIAVAAIVALTAVISSGYWMYHAYDMQRSEQLRLAIEKERQAAEAQRKAADEKLADEVHQRQAVIDAETRERQAKLEAETLAAKAALERAEAEKKRLDQELKRTTREKRPAESPVQDPAVDKAKTARPPQTAPPQSTKKAPQAANLNMGVDRFDGIYNGRLCSRPGLPGEKCWPVALKIEHGTLSAAWPHGASGNTSYAKGTISTDGAIAMTLHGWQQNGRPTSANMTGTWDSDTIRVSGTWQGAIPVTGNWKHGF